MSTQTKPNRTATTDEVTLDNVLTPVPRTTVSPVAPLATDPSLDILDPVKESPVGFTFASDAIAAIHSRQTALEFDRREQERLARLAELANRD